MITNGIHKRVLKIEPHAFEKILDNMELFTKKYADGVAGIFYSIKDSEIAILWDGPYFTVSAFRVSFYWARYLKEHIDIWESTTFEEAFEEIPEEAQEKILFHLDMFL